MRDDSQKWDAPFSSDDLLQAPGLSIATLPLDRLTSVNGTRALAGSDLPVIGWPDIAPGGGYAVALRRDRILEVNGPARPDGWDSAQGIGFSDVTDGYHAFSVTGAAAMEFLRAGAELSLELPSKSAARLVFGLPAILYRIGGDAFALIVTRPQAAAAWHAFGLVLENAPRARQGLLPGD